jgi:N-carbamoyl-L-amino-acid hydrolase
VVPNPEGCIAYRPPVRSSAFLECHIEQGLRLVDANERVGVVTGVVGIRRYTLQGLGEANHAGTTEMRRRRDALVPVARVIAELPGAVEDLDDAVVTCGRIVVRPGAPNIVPGRVEAVVEIRAQDTKTMDLIEQRVRDLVAASGRTAPGKRAASLDLQPIVAVDPVATDAGLRHGLVDLLREKDVRHCALPSMAGHDTQHAAYRCPSGMFFIPSIGGVSHNPDENSTEEDIALAGEVMTAWVEHALARAES